jgi:hypothetical protein
MFGSRAAPDVTRPRRLDLRARALRPSSARLDAAFSRTSRSRSPMIEDLHRLGLVVVLNFGPLAAYTNECSSSVGVRSRPGPSCITAKSGCRRSLGSKPVGYFVTATSAFASCGHSAGYTRGQGSETRQNPVRLASICPTIPTRHVLRESGKALHIYAHCRARGFTWIGAARS